MSQKALYFRLNQLFASRAALLSAGEADRHTDHPTVTLLANLMTLAQLLEPIAVYIAKREAGRLIDKGLVTSENALRRFGTTLRDLFRREVKAPSDDIRATDRLISDADAVFEPVIQQAGDSGGDMRPAWEAAQQAAISFLKAELHMPDSDARWLSRSIVEEVLTAVEAARKLR